MMRISIIMKASAVVLMIGLFAVLSIQSVQAVQAVDPLVKRTLALAPVGEGNALASGAAEDTLKACMARIPVVASVGQRMLAEQTCRGQEETRKAIQSAPKF
ncbi:MAG: hypothetical protein HP494_18395 [Nitrospira sp.]|nr:hypothetical protein [Nitrospira sp.]